MNFITLTLAESAGTPNERQVSIRTDLIKYIYHGNRQPSTIICERKEVFRVKESIEEITDLARG